MSNERFVSLKMLTIGDSAVGKTCLLQRYALGTFQSTFISTIGIDFHNKSISVDGQPVRLQLWDTAGQERFRTITTSYFRGSHGILLVYDVSDKKSFKAVERWLTCVREKADSSVDVMLVGNKCDLARRAVSKEKAQALADSHGLPYIETSAKENINVDKCFDTLTRMVLQRVLKPGGDGASKTEGVSLGGGAGGGAGEGSGKCAC